MGNYHQTNCTTARINIETR
uniref:Uncharacterized protein n=1 Tax=Arundo donax TaxID=35708 RepID=A0A0A8Z4M1_ARUDO